MAAHSGHKPAQRRYGYYVVGYYMTDGMFWPRDKDTAADALAMLRVFASDSPELVGEDRTWILGGFEPGSDQKPLPREWVKRAKELEVEYRKCTTAKPDVASTPH